MRTFSTIFLTPYLHKTLELSGQASIYFIQHTPGLILFTGDMGIAVPTAFVSTNDLIPTRNSLSTLFAAMDPITGALQYSGPPLNLLGSDTYHAWTIIGVYNYFLYSGDIDLLETVWTNYVRNVIKLVLAVALTFWYLQRPRLYNFWKTRSHHLVL